MTIYYIKPVIDLSVRNLCSKSYYNHPKGCPNHGKRKICPPLAPIIDDFFNLSKGIMAVVAHFNLAQHVEKMRQNHPNWTYRQCSCCLYWQGKVRKWLKKEVEYNLTRYTLFDSKNLLATDCPEAMGVDVTATMADVGLVLEWPPKNIVRKIAFIGTPKD